MEKKSWRLRARELLRGGQGAFDAILAFFSAAAIATVVVNEFISANTAIPFISMTLAQLQVVVRIVIWASFVLHFLVHVVVADRPLQHIRSHKLQLIVCITWLPFYQEAILHQVLKVLSLEFLQLIGTIAHGMLLAGWAIRRFAAHPVIVTGSAALLLIGSAAAVLHQIEPQTFPTMFDAVWYSVVTVTTVGYGDFAPRTQLGRMIGMALIVGGVSLIGVFIGVVSDVVRRSLLKEDRQAEGCQCQSRCDQVLKELNEQRQILEDQRRRSEAVLQEVSAQRQLLEDLRGGKAKEKGPPGE